MIPKKDILLLSYYFPPLGMGGVGRPHALYRHLPEFGYNVIVLTVKDVLYPAYDYSLLDDKDEESIIRTGSVDPARILHLLGLKRRGKSYIGSSGAARFFFPDSKRGWNRFALRKARHIIEKGNISALITTSPPPSTHIVGLKLKALSGIPWIADFRDFWFSLPIELVYPTRIHKSYALRLKQKIVGLADAVVVVNNSIKNYLGRGEVIMNGADIELSRHWRFECERSNDKFTIGILGTINELCPVESLFKAIASLIADDVSLQDKLSIVHVGHCDMPMITTLANKYSLGDIVSLRGYLPKARALESLAIADMLFFSVNTFGKYNILPGRIFDYLMSGKPILGVVPPNSDAAHLLKEYGHSKVIMHERITEASAYIHRLYDNWMSNGQRQDYAPPDKTEFSTVSLARRYAELLDRIAK